ncbi:MAG: N-acetylmuramoyl-L-alanine amidase [Puniceicoccales bacterium]|jgi:N-acetylmuramoyl-L-alanine amidase|nr:N-acetylmuramoyl-L-alanine amidase [Puniceicoccales bacterium]
MSFKVFLFASIFICAAYVASCQEKSSKVGAAQKSKLVCIKNAGTEYVSLESIAKDFDAEIVRSGYSVTISKSGVIAKFVSKDRYFYYNDCKLFICNPILLWKKKLYLAMNDYESYVQPMFSPKVIANSTPGLKTIVIDPGHGGKDSGTVNRLHRLEEKNLTLAVAKIVQAELKLLGFNAILTRNSDVHRELADRVADANSVKADFFVSIHFNSADSKSARGVEIFTLTPAGQPSSYSSNRTASDSVSFAGNEFDHWNTIAGYSMLYSMKQRLKFSDRGVKHARFEVLKRLSCPGILIETEFLSNNVVAKLFTTQDYIENTALAIVNGVYRYYLNINAISKLRS